MSRVIAVDPGKNGCGVAVFDQKRLTFAQYLATRSVADFVHKSATGQSTLIRIEFPRIYAAAKQKGDQNDLLHVARAAGHAEAGAVRAGAAYALVEPREWKGTIAGDTFIEERIKPAIEVGETSRISFPSAESLHHNVYDAIGIGLHAVGRLNPRKVYPR